MLAKVINTWRSHGKALEFRNMFKAKYGAARADELCHRLPQRALTGRWGSKNATEAHFLSIGKSQLQTVWSAMFLSEKKEKERKKKMRKTSMGDDEGGETYSDVRNRWIREASEGMRQYPYIFILQSQNRALLIVARAHRLCCSSTNHS